MRTDEAACGLQALLPCHFVPIVLDDSVGITVLAGATIPWPQIGAHAKALDLRRELFHEQQRGAHLHQRRAAPGEEFDDIEGGSRFGFCR